LQQEHDIEQYVEVEDEDAKGRLVDQASDSHRQDKLSQQI